MHRPAPISGTPATPGNYIFTVTVKDAANTTAQKVFTLVVAPGVTFTTPAALPDATAGTPYSFTLQAGGGQAPYTWRIADGALPDGLALNATTGTIAGTPQAPGTFNFTVEVTDASGLKASRVHTIVATLPGVPTLNITGIPTNLAPLQQPSIDVALSRALSGGNHGAADPVVHAGERNAGRSFGAVLVGWPVGGVHDCGECHPCDLRRAAVRATVGERRRRAYKSRWTRWPPGRCRCRQRARRRLRHRFRPERSSRACPLHGRRAALACKSSA